MQIADIFQLITRTLKLINLNHTHEINRQGKLYMFRVFRRKMNSKVAYKL
jgi:hypothetical protein